MAKNKLSITPAAVRKAAEECPEAKKVLNTLFPEAFVKEPYDFGTECTLDLIGGGRPLLIGHGLAPSGLKGKCLMLCAGWDYKVEQHQGHTMFTFFEEQQ